MANTQSKIITSAYGSSLSSSLNKNQTSRIDAKYKIPADVQEDFNRLVRFMSFAVLKDNAVMDKRESANVSAPFGDILIRYFDNALTNQDILSLLTLIRTNNQQVSDMYSLPSSSTETALTDDDRRHIRYVITDIFGMDASTDDLTIRSGSYAETVYAYLKGLYSSSSLSPYDARFLKVYEYFYFIKALCSGCPNLSLWNSAFSPVLHRTSVYNAAELTNPTTLRSEPVGVGVADGRSLTINTYSVQYQFDNPLYVSADAAAPRAITLDLFSLADPYTTGAVLDYSSKTNLARGRFITVSNNVYSTVKDPSGASLIDPISWTNRKVSYDSSPSVGVSITTGGIMHWDRVLAAYDGSGMYDNLSLSIGGIDAFPLITPAKILVSKMANAGIISAPAKSITDILSLLTVTMGDDTTDPSVPISVDSEHALAVKSKKIFLGLTKADAFGAASTSDISDYYVSEKRSADATETSYMESRRTPLYFVLSDIILNDADPTDSAILTAMHDIVLMLYGQEEADALQGSSGLFTQFGATHYWRISFSCVYKEFNDYINTITCNSVLDRILSSWIQPESSSEATDVYDKIGPSLYGYLDALTFSSRFGITENELDYIKNIRTNSYIVRKTRDSDIAVYYVGDVTGIGTDVSWIPKFLTVYSKVRDYYYRVLRCDAFTSQQAYPLYEKTFIIVMAINEYFNSQIENISDVNGLSLKDCRNYMISLGLEDLSKQIDSANFTDSLSYRRRIVAAYADIMSLKGSRAEIDELLSIFDYSTTDIDIYRYVIYNQKNDVPHYYPLTSAGLLGTALTSSPTNASGTTVSSSGTKDLGLATSVSAGEQFEIPTDAESVYGPALIGKDDSYGHPGDILIASSALLTPSALKDPANWVLLRPVSYDTMFHSIPYKTDNVSYYLKTAASGTETTTVGYSAMIASDPYWSEDEVPEKTLGSPAYATFVYSQQATKYLELKFKHDILTDYVRTKYSASMISYIAEHAFNDSESQNVLHNMTATTSLTGTSTPLSIATLCGIVEILFAIYSEQSMKLYTSVSSYTPPASTDYPKRYLGLSSSLTYADIFKSGDATVGTKDGMLNSLIKDCFDKQKYLIQSGNSFAVKPCPVFLSKPTSVNPSSLTSVSNREFAEGIASSAYNSIAFASGIGLIPVYASGSGSIQYNESWNILMRDISETLASATGADSDQISILKSALSSMSYLSLNNSGATTDAEKAMQNKALYYYYKQAALSGYSTDLNGSFYKDFDAGSSQQTSFSDNGIYSYIFDRVISFPVSCLLGEYSHSSGYKHPAVKNAVESVFYNFFMTSSPDGLGADDSAYYTRHFTDMFLDTEDFSVRNAVLYYIFSTYCGVGESLTIAGETMSSIVSSLVALPITPVSEALVAQTKKKLVDAMSVLSETISSLKDFRISYYVSDNLSNLMNFVSLCISRFISYTTKVYRIDMTYAYSNAGDAVDTTEDVRFDTSGSESETLYYDESVSFSDDGPIGG